MPISQQKINYVYFKKLKNLKDLEISFTEKRLHAIYGPNGSGKSTIIHSLCCIYKPIDTDSVNYKFSGFFTPTNHGTWTGSKFHIKHTFRDGVNLRENESLEYTKQSDRWAPKYDRRPERYVTFIGIRSCVPAIELETSKNRIEFNTTPLNDAESNKVRSVVGYIMNRNYTQYNLHKTSKGKYYFGVRHAATDYSSLSMGAGEQRLFHIISEVIKAPSHSMILIDEIDLLIHNDALKRLLEKLNEISEQKHLQIIFSSHNHSILGIDFVSYYHLFQTSNKTICFYNTKPDAIKRLTGEQVRPLEIFVEDDLAETVVKKVAADLGIKKYISVNLFGAADNCFASAAGAILTNTSNLDNMLFVLDGDVYRNNDDKETRMKKILTGDTAALNEKRKQALRKIEQFILPEGIKPEKHIHEILCKIDDNLLNPEHKEIITIAKSIEQVDDAHKYLGNIIDEMGDTRELGLNKIINIYSSTNEWKNYISKIEEWLLSKKESLEELIEEE